MMLYSRHSLRAGSGVQRARSAPSVTSSFAKLAAKSSRAACVLPRASNDTKDKSTESESKKFAKVMDELKKQGMTPGKARQLLKAWQQMGATNPAELRALLMERSKEPILQLLTQAGLDAAASVGAFYIGGLFGEMQDFPGQIAIQFGSYFIGFYYFLNAIFESSALVGVLVSVQKYGSTSDEILAAVQQLAGPATGVSLVDKAAKAVNTIKVLQALDKIVQLLKDQSGDLPKPDTLQSLATYLTLQKAKEEYGFDPAKYGMSERKAADVAQVFSNYDLNDDGRLESSELGKLCDSLGQSLEESEVREALKILDTNKSGFIEFTEFMDWWISKPGGGAKAQQA